MKNRYIYIANIFALILPLGGAVAQDSGVEELLYQDTSILEDEMEKEVVKKNGELKPAPKNKENFITKNIELNQVPVHEALSAKNAKMPGLKNQLEEEVIDELLAETELYAYIDAEGYQPFDGEDFTLLNSPISSMFFSPEQIDLLYNSLKRYKQSGGNLAATIRKVGVNVQGEEISEEQVFVPITFYLASLIYPADKDWTIWLNGKKIRKENEKTELKDSVVTNINSNHVVIDATLEAGTLNMNSPEYKTKLLPVTEPDGKRNWDYASEDGKIKLDSAAGVVRFKIGMNQTFSLYDMVIKEGIYMPVVAGVPEPTTTEKIANAVDNVDIFQPVEDPVRDAAGLNGAIENKAATTPVAVPDEIKAPVETPPATQNFNLPTIDGEAPVDATDMLMEKSEGN